MQGARSSKTNRTHSKLKDQVDDCARSSKALVGLGKPSNPRSKFAGRSQSCNAPTEQYSQTSSKEAPAYPRNFASPPPPESLFPRSRDASVVPRSYPRDKSTGPGYRQSRDGSLAPLKPMSPDSLHGLPYSHSRHMQSHPRDNSAGPGYQQPGDVLLSPSQSHSKSAKRAPSCDQPLLSKRVAANSHASDHLKPVREKRQHTDILTDDETGWLEDDSEDEVDVKPAAIAKPVAKKQKTTASARATVSSIRENDNLNAVYLYTRALLAAYIFAIEPFPDNSQLVEVISHLTVDSWDENPHLRGTSFSESQLKTVS